jgi:hypothetical protein
LRLQKHIEYKLKDSTFPTSDSTKPSIETNESSKDKPATVPDRSHRQSTFIKPGRTTATTVTAPPSSPEVQELQQEVERLQGLVTLSTAKQCTHLLEAIGISDDD